MTTKLKGELEIDPERGVIYFHHVSGATLLRIQNLPVPIPTTGCLLDLSWGIPGLGPVASWESGIPTRRQAIELLASRRCLADCGACPPCRARTARDSSGGPG